MHDAHVPSSPSIMKNVPLLRYWAISAADVRSRSMNARSIPNAALSNATIRATSSAPAIRRVITSGITLPSGPVLSALTRQFAVLDPVRLIGGGAEAALAVGLVVLIVPFEPDHLAVALEGEH